MGQWEVLTVHAFFRPVMFSAWVLDIGSKSSSLLWINLYTPEGAILHSKIVVRSCGRRGDNNAALSFLRPDSLKGS